MPTRRLTKSGVFSLTNLFYRVAKSCKEDSCRQPWSVLFPDGEVRDLRDAMETQYDAFFANQPKVSFTTCGMLYLPAEEGPQDVNAFAGNNSSANSTTT